MKALKKICLLFCLLNVNEVVAEQSYHDWKINDDSLFMTNEHSEKMIIICSDFMYLATINMRYVKEEKIKSENGDFFEYLIDNHRVIFKGTRDSLSWIVPSIWYKDGKNQISGDIGKYKTLFQQMLHAKKSLVVNAIDADGKIQGTAKFSVKGLPEALIEFAKQCGSDFQTFSGIEVNQPDNSKPE